MADDQPDKSEKTEDPTQKKLEDAQKRGDVVKSQEVTTWFMIFGSTLLFALMAPMASGHVVRSLEYFVANADRLEVGGPGLGPVMEGLAWSVLVPTLLPLSALMLAAVAANLVQHQPVLSVDPIKPKLSKISPIQGFKRLFSLEALVNFAKGMVKLGVVGAVMFFVMWPERARLDTMMTMDANLILVTFQQLGVKLLVATLMVVTVIAVGDYMYQRYKWWERQKMTMKEVRDEHKQMEGDPQVKSRIRQLRQQRAQKRMMASVPESTVVVTNPTHYAVALKYDESMEAPMCVAKGQDAVALRIREMAREHDVPIVENPPLARALHGSVDIDGTIPVEHFKAVAQVIGYVMRLKSRRAWQS